MYITVQQSNVWYLGLKAVNRSGHILCGLNVNYVTMSFGYILGGVDKYRYSI